MKVVTGPIIGPKGDTPDPNWRQLITSRGDLDISPATRVANGPFDDDIAGQYRCSAGCVLGLNLISELILKGKALNGRQIAFTRRHVWVRRGCLVPRPLTVISPEFRQMLEGPFGRRCCLEIAHQGDDSA